MEILEYLNYAPAVAGIVGIIATVKIFVKYIGNHMSEATKAQSQLTEAIHMMLKFLETH